MKRLNTLILTTGMLLSLASSCFDTRVTRVSEKKMLDLSGRWNDTDSRLVAEEMVKSITNGKWLERFRSARTQYPAAGSASSSASSSGSSSSSSTSSGGPQSHLAPRPVVIVGEIVNKSHEHIAPDTFINDIEAALINAGDIRVVANSALKEKIRSERLSQAAHSGFVSPEQQKSFGRELGADYMLFGVINTIVDTDGSNSVTYYQINLKLTDVETNEVVWVGEKKIKKYRGGKRIKGKYKGKLPKS